MQAQHDHLQRNGAAKAEVQQALTVLTEANLYAENTSRNLWEFAVEIQILQSLGLTLNDLRFLVRSQYVDHAKDVTVEGNTGRRFHPTGDLFFTQRTCFVITLKGIAAAKVHPNPATFAGDDSACLTAIFPLAGLEHRELRSPIWNPKRRLLYFDHRIVKRFKWRAINQEMILSVFQEEGWPERIDDPLSPSPSVDMKRRLSDTIKCLNRGQEYKLIQFRGDGTGEGVIWESAILASTNGT